MIAISPISRYRAALVHLAISAAIAAAALALMLTLWFPPPLFGAMGGTELALLIVGVDVAIGPLITLIIFDTRKKELIFDLAVVAVLQMGALAYGVYAMHAGRPVFIVFAESQFAVVPAAEIDANDLAQGRSEEFRTLSLTGPRLVATEEPTDPEVRSTIVFGSLAGFGVQHLPKYYVPYAKRRGQVLRESRSLADLDPAPPDRERLNGYLKRSGRKVEELRCLPVKTKRAVLTAIIDSSNGDLLDVLDIEPAIGAR